MLNNKKPLTTRGFLFYQYTSLIIDCLFVVYYVVVNCLYMVHLLHTNIHILYKDLPQIYKKYGQGNPDRIFIAYICARIRICSVRRMLASRPSGIRG